MCNYERRGLSVPFPLRFVFRQRKYSEKIRYTNIYRKNFDARRASPRRNGGPPRKAGPPHAAPRNGGSLLAAPRLVGFDDAAFRGADEPHERVALVALRHDALDLVAGGHVVQSALEEDAAGVVDLGDALLREAAARKSDLVDAGETERVVAHDDERRQVLPEQRAALDHRVFADVGPLVDGRVAADDHPVADVHLARERDAVGDDAVAAHHAVVADMGVGHQQVVRSYARRARGGRAAADGDVFADVVVVADLAHGLLAGELQVLRQTRHRGGRVDLAAAAEARSVVDHGAGTDPAAVADHDVGCDAGERFHRHVGPEPGFGVDVGKFAYHRRATFCS